MNKYDLVNGISISEPEWLQVSSMLVCFNQVCAESDKIDIDACIKFAKSYDYWINIDADLDTGPLIDLIPSLDRCIDNVVFLDGAGRINVLAALRRMKVWEMFSHRPWSSACKIGATKSQLLAVMQIVEDDARPGVMVSKHA